jgi:hypothetical protein
MDPITAVILLVLGFLFLPRLLGGATNPLTGQPFGTSSYPVTPTQPSGFTGSQAGSAIGAVNSATGAIEGALKAGSSLAKAVPIIGGVIDSLISYFSAASQKRAQQARTENQAVANAVPGWDNALNQIVNAYNNGNITASQVSQAMRVIWQNYWNEVGPQVQPDRNACQSGTMPKSVADSQFPGMKQCSGPWGAGCCVAYADLANGEIAINAAVALTEKTGQPAPATIPAVFASKYGGSNRAAYTVIFRRPVSAFRL